MLTSKISSKGQVTLPKEVRKKVHLGPGDLIEYEILDNAVRIRKVEPFDRAFHASLETTLTEWASPEDEKAFRDL